MYKTQPGEGHRKKEHKETYSAPFGFNIPPWVSVLPIELMAWKMARLAYFGQELKTTFLNN